MAPESVSAATPAHRPVRHLDGFPACSIGRRRLLLGLSALLLGASLVINSVAGELFTREEVDHGFGTDPDGTHYPESAIDTDEAPNIVLGASDKAADPLRFYLIAPDTHMFFGNIAEVDEINRGWNGNAGFVVTDEGVVVIDALGTPRLGERMISSIRAVTDKPIRYLIVTHNHPDHAYGAIAFRRLAGVIIVGHEGTLRYLGSDRIEHSVAYRRTFIPEDMSGFEPVRPDIMVGGRPYSRLRFLLGGKTFDVYNVGAHHSYGDLIVYQREDRIVWISDLAFNQRLTYMADGSSRAAIEAQGWLLETFPDARLMVPGHGSAQTAPFPMVSLTRNYMQGLRDLMANAIAQDVGLADAVEQGEFPAWKNVRLYELNHRPNLNFVYREMEEALF